MESFGSGKFGVTPWGGYAFVAPSTQAMLIAAEAIRENVVLLTFTEPMYFSRWLDPGDASQVSHYGISPDMNSVGIDGLPPRAVFPGKVVKPFDSDGTMLELWLDRAMSPTGALYRVTVSNIVAVSGNPLLTTSATFNGVRQGLPQVVIDAIVGNRDFANPQSTSAGISLTNNDLGKYHYDSTGDIGIDQGLVSYKKRVFRRLTTRKGAFRHNPSYGVLIPNSVKRLARANLVDSIAADAEDQIRQEPETVKVSVRIVPATTPGLYVYRVTAQTTFGDLTHDVPVPI